MEVVRVQSIASCALDSIPVEFIRSEKERPVATTFSGPAPEIPTIDLSNPDRQLLVQGIANASSEWGLFQVVNHGIPDQVIKNLKKVGEEFFELPQQEKDSYANKPEYGFEGYGTKHPKGEEGKIPWVDNFFHNIWPPSIINHNIWPKNPPSYKECNEEYAKHIQGVVNELLSFLSLGLGLEHGVLKEAIGSEDVEYLLKINYYPPCPRPDLALGVAPHTDMSLLTVLVPNEVPGLQIFKDDLWFDAKYIPNAIIVHIGDQTEILSNGKYKSVLHRTTLSKDKVRMSWPVFISPPPEAIIGPLPQLVNENNPPNFKTKKYKDYVYCKVNKLPQ